MKELFASIYENVIFEAAHRIIFSHLFDNGGYIYLGMIFLLIPLLFTATFYFLYIWNPYAKWWHWLIVLIICLITVYGITYSIVNEEIFASSNRYLNDALANPELQHSEYGKGLLFKYGALNSGLGFIVFILYSFIFKQYSKLHAHLPI